MSRPGRFTPPVLLILLLASAAPAWGGGSAVEELIELAYRRCFRTRTIGDRELLLRVPFAEEEPSPDGRPGSMRIVGAGKGSPLVLWRAVDRVLSSAAFSRYVAAMEDGEQKIVRFDRAGRSWFATPGLPTGGGSGDELPPGAAELPGVLAPGTGITAASVSDYLSCVAGIGMDCSGFVWYVLGSIARAGGVNLDREIGRDLGVRPSAVPLYVNASFLDPRHGRVREVHDEVGKLEPGDVILFRGTHGTVVHSAVIQSVDLARGRIRYLQCTDLAPPEERGVHESSITFDPSHPEARLGDAGVSWQQVVSAPFLDEPAPRFSDDGERFRFSSPEGSGTVVRLLALEPALSRLRRAAPAIRRR